MLPTPGKLALAAALAANAGLASTETFDRAPQEYVVSVGSRGGWRASAFHQRDKAPDGKLGQDQPSAALLDRLDAAPSRLVSELEAKAPAKPRP